MQVLSFFEKNNLVAAGKIQAGKGLKWLCPKELPPNNSNFSGRQLRFAQLNCDK